jgi:prepilin-type processing-associated H-X9-DG protein
LAADDFPFVYDVTGQTVDNGNEFIDFVPLCASYGYASHTWTEEDNAKAWAAWRIYSMGQGNWGLVQDQDADLSNVPAICGPNNDEPCSNRGNGGGSTLYRLREGIERFLITDINNPAGSAVAQSSVVVFWDVFAANTAPGGPAGQGVMKFNHVPGGANVLFMDGHVEFIKYPGEFPLAPSLAVLQTTGLVGQG